MLKYLDNFYIVIKYEVYSFLYMASLDQCINMIVVMTSQTKHCRNKNCRKNVPSVLRPYITFSEMIKFNMADTYVIHDNDVISREA